MNIPDRSPPLVQTGSLLGPPSPPCRSDPLAAVKSEIRRLGCKNLSADVLSRCGLINLFQRRAKAAASCR